MNNKIPVHHGYSVTSRQPEGEGVLRMLLLAVAVAMPLASMAYLKIQHTRLSYAMSEVRADIKKQEELQRNLLLERSHYQKDEEIQVFAEKVGMMPRKQSYLIHRNFTTHDQKLAKLRPVFSDE
ncbi:MAG: hypothetical protein H6Q00_496 [Holophagaceae bacterium]|nr:hypothetical protein [Holophagaceae bacterium]